jgi:endonuclease/exonuclease/phosphatase family metal-dependent hydrolase
VRLRVLTCNIRFGTDILGRPRLADQAAVVSAARPDLVLLQEVLPPSQAEQLARAAGLEHLALGPARRTSGGEFGNAILSRWPLVDVENRAVPGPRLISQPRAVLAATAVLDEHRLRVAAAHFGIAPGEAERAARAALDMTLTSSDAIVVGGDFNRPLPHAMCHRLLRRHLVDCAAADGRIPRATFPSPKPVLRLDYLYVRDLNIEHVEVLPTTASDHRPLVADLLLPARG